MILSVNSGIGSSVGLFKSGLPIICLEEERFSRTKGYMGFPKNALQHILDHEATLGSINKIALCNLSDHSVTRDAFYAYYDKAFKQGVEGKHFNLEYVKGLILRSGRLGPLYKKLRTKKHSSSLRADIQQLMSFGFSPDIIDPVDHHTCHAASAYYGLAPDPSENYLILTCDGGGDDRTSSVWRGGKGTIKCLSESNCYSIGNIYSMTTHFLGFRSHEHEYKLMGLAPYTSNKYAEEYAEFFSRFLELKEDGTVFYNPNFINHPIFANKLSKTFRNDRFDNIAAGLQLFTERIVVAWVTNNIKKYGIRNILCSGGTFMNVKLNKLIAEIPTVNFVDVFPSCGDESNIFGAAYYTDARENKQTSVARLKKYTLGTDISRDLNEALSLFDKKIKYKKILKMDEYVAKMLAKNKLLARCTGKMEFGARALGNRSILANPSNLKNVGTINRAVKNRDFWMPFAPMVLDSEAKKYLSVPKSLSKNGSPFMMFATDSNKKSRDDMICSIHPADFTARPQIIDFEKYPEMHSILTFFKKITGTGVLLNTSYNLHGYPIVENSHQAIEVFLQTELDILIIDSVVIWKNQQ